MQPSEDRRIRRLELSVKRAWEHFTNEWNLNHIQGTQKDKETVDRLKSQVEQELVKFLAVLNHESMEVNEFEIVAEVEQGMPDYPLLNLGGGPLISPFHPSTTPNIATTNLSTPRPSVDRPVHVSPGSPALPADETAPFNVSTGSLASARSSEVAQRAEVEEAQLACQNDLAFEELELNQSIQ